MGDLVVERASSASVAELWRVATDWDGHGRFFPGTSVRALTPESAVGQRVSAITRIGPLRLHDEMRVTRWEPPGASGRCEVRKVGRVIGGRTVIEVEPVGSGSLLRWTTDVGPAPRLAHRLLSPVSKLIAAPLYRRVVGGMVAEAGHD